MKNEFKTLAKVIILCITMVSTACSKEALVDTNDINNVDPKDPDNTDPGNGSSARYSMPSEEETHEGTWLQWPHNFTYGYGHSQKHDATWVKMVQALHTGENVHIVVYNETEKERVEDLLINVNVDMTKIDFNIWKTDDYWVRDNGPIFVYDKDDKLVIQNWGFNGWGNKTPSANCNKIPTKAGQSLNMQVVNVDMINEGGSVELDGNGTLMAKRSSILNSNRNPGLTQAQAEEYFRTYLGVANFIWFEGNKGGDITDDHIDGTARFAKGNTIVTYNKSDSDPTEYSIMRNAKNMDGEHYNIVNLPLTQNNLHGTNDIGIYINFYVGNTVVLVPNFDDPNDSVANSILQNLYPNKTVIGIPAIELGLEGGGVHCITQQQTLAQ